MLAVIRRFGLLEVPAPAHAAGKADDPGEDRFDLGRLGCGLAGCRITPLHAARLAGALADGHLDAPRWIERVVDGSGRELPLPGGRRVAPRDAPTGSPRSMREMMIETTRARHRAPRLQPAAGGR